MRFVLALLLLSFVAPVRAGSDFAPLVAVPAGAYRPLFGLAANAPDVRVDSFSIDVRPVTNGEFLEFVRTHPQWRRSQVKRLFADEGYLTHWAGDLDLGTADPLQPVTRVSWFAAKAFAAACGKRLPSTAEWEYVAGIGFSSMNGAKEPAFREAVARWYATPSAPVLPPADSGAPNLLGIRALHGLVWEWTSDFNSAILTGDARNDAALERQMFCGNGATGARDRTDYAAFMRFGLRSSLRANYTVQNLGFRCAK